jgi:hypothetical protein
MRGRRRVAIVALLLWPALASAKATPAERCTAAKLKAAGAKTAARIKCQVKAIGHGHPVDPGCLARAEAPFAARFAQAERKPGCITTGDAAAVEAAVDGWVGVLVGALSGSSTGLTTTTTVLTTTTTSTTTTTVTCGGIVPACTGACGPGKSCGPDAGFSVCICR